MNPANEEITARARRIRLLLIDCDGVLTDGSLLYSFDGKQVLEGARVFHIQDGQGLRLAREAGLKLGIISGRISAALSARANELQFDHLHLGHQRQTRRLRTDQNCRRLHRRRDRLHR